MASERTITAKGWLAEGPGTPLFRKAMTPNELREFCAELAAADPAGNAAIRVRRTWRGGIKQITAKIEGTR